MVKRLSPLMIIASTGIFGALTFLATFFLGIPYAGGAGYFCFGDAVALLATYLFGPIVGLGSALIGGLLSDLLKGYAAFMPFTALAKTLMVISAFLFFYLLRKKPKVALLGFFLGGALMPFGYLPAYLWLYPDAAWMSFGFDFIQGVGCAAIALLLSFPMAKALKETGFH